MLIPSENDPLENVHHVNNRDFYYSNGIFHLSSIFYCSKKFFCYNRYLTVLEKEGPGIMRNEKKQLSRLERSFLDIVLTEGTFFFNPIECNETKEFQFHFPLALKHAKFSGPDRKKEEIYDTASLAVKTLIDNSLMPSKRIDPVVDKR